jgi:glycosyltransferase involved in cell wall biosynthesis
MSMRSITTDGSTEFQRGAVIVCIAASGESAEVLRTLRSVLGHSDRSIAILVAGAAAAVEWVAQQLPDEIADRTVLGLTTEAGNEVVTVNTAIRATAPGDLVLVGRGVRVAAGWLEGLRAAATSDSTVASATPLCLGSGGVDLFGEEGHHASETLDQAADRVAARAMRLRPRIAVMGPGCTYIRRAALDLADALDESLPIDEALADLALRLTALGTVHVLADDVLVQGDVIHRSTGRAGTAAPQIGDAIRETVAKDEHGPLHRAINWARATLDRLSVTIDGRALTPTAGGTQTYIIDLIVALAGSGEVAVRVLVPPDLSLRAAEALASAPGVELLTYEQAIDHARPTDIVHRPQQVFTLDDLALLRLVGERVVIGQQDLIAYHNQSYHRDVAAWRTYRRTTRLALAGADQTIFFSEHARRDALAEDLLPERRTHVVGIGVETLGSPALPESCPVGVESDEQFLLCLGADYAHKNRPFAIELLRELRQLGWAGRLVLAGAHVPYGSSREREHELFRQDAELADVVVDLGPVSEPNRNWLYAHARALVYPTLFEGFGLLPLEAARADLPCLFAPQASLHEMAGNAATLIPWDVAASAAVVLPVLSPGPARDTHLAQLRALSIPSWNEIASRLLDVYERALREPCTEAAPHVWQELDRESYITTLEGYQDAYRSLEARVGIGLPLIDQGGLLSHDQQRGLMRVAARGWVGSLALKPFGLLGGLGTARRSESHVAGDGRHEDRASDGGA